MTPYSRIGHSPSVRQGLEGYRSQIKTRVPIEFHIIDDWIPEKEGEQAINYKIAELNNSAVILRNVINRERDIVFDFEVKTNVKKNKNHGEFLSVINETNPQYASGLVEEWELFGEDGTNLIYESKQINGYGSGEGPGNTFSFNLDKQYEDLMKSNMVIRYSGLVLYEYSRR